MLLQAGGASFVPSGSPLDAVFGLFRMCARAPLLPASGRSFLARPTKGRYVPPCCCDYHENDNFHIAVAADANYPAVGGVAAIGAGVFLATAFFAVILGIGDPDRRMIHRAAVVEAEAVVLVVVALSSCYPPETLWRCSNPWETHSRCPNPWDDDPSSKHDCRSCLRFVLFLWWS